MKQQKQQESELGEVGMTAEAEAAFFDSVDDQVVTKGELMFSQLNLSRPLLRGVEACGYVTPTPVQAKVIPVALAGRDVCASAVTGSGMRKRCFIDSYISFDCIEFSWWEYEFTFRIFNCN